MIDIAEERGVSLDTLQLLNPSLDLDFVIPGQELLVPLRPGLAGALHSLRAGAEDVVTLLMQLMQQGSQSLGGMSRGLQTQAQGQGEGAQSAALQADGGQVHARSTTGSLRKRSAAAVWEEGVRQRQARAERRRQFLAGQGRGGGTPGSRSARARSSPEPEWRASRRTPGGATTSRQRTPVTPTAVSGNKQHIDALPGIEFHVPQELQRVLAQAGRHVESASSAVQSELAQAQRELAQAASNTSQGLISAAAVAQKSVASRAAETERGLAMGLARAQEGLAAGMAAGKQGLLAAGKGLSGVASAVQEGLTASAKAAKEGFQATMEVTQARAASAQQGLSASLGVAKEGLATGMLAAQKELSSAATRTQQGLSSAVTEAQQGLQATAVVAQKGAAVAQKELSASLEVASQGLAAGVTAAQQGVAVGMASAQKGLSSSVTAAQHGVAVGVANAQKGLSSSVSAAQRGLSSAVVATEQLLGSPRDTATPQAQLEDGGQVGAHSGQEEGTGVCVAPASAAELAGSASGALRSSSKGAQKGLRQRKGKGEGTGKAKEGRSGRAPRRGDMGSRGKEQARARSAEEGSALESEEEAQMLEDESRRLRGRLWTLHMPFGDQEEPSGRAELEEYMVQPGDSLASIADQHGVPWQDLTALNELVLSDGSLLEIHVGQILRIPSRSFSPGALSVLPSQLRTSIADAAAAASALLQAIPARVATMGAAVSGVPQPGARSQLVSAGGAQSVVLWSAGLLVMVLGLAKVASRAFWGSARVPPKTTLVENRRTGPRTVLDEAIEILPKDPVIVSKMVPAPALNKPKSPVVKRTVAKPTVRQTPASSTGCLPLQADMAGVLERAQLESSAALSLGGLACASGYGSSLDIPALAIDSACRGAAAGFRTRLQKGMEVLCLVSMVGCPGSSPWHQRRILPQAQNQAQRDYSARAAAYQAARGSVGAGAAPEDVFQFPCLGLAYELLPSCTMLGASLSQLDSRSPSRAPWWYPPAPPPVEPVTAQTTDSLDPLVAGSRQGTLPPSPAQRAGSPHLYGPGFHASVLLLAAPDSSGKGGLLLGATASLNPLAEDLPSKPHQEKLQITSAVDAASKSLQAKLQVRPWPQLVSTLFCRSTALTRLSSLS